MDYVHSNPNTTIRYHASDMCLYIDSDAAYLIQARANSVITGHFYLSNMITPTSSKPDPTNNGPILTECRTVRNIMSSAAEVETIGIYHNIRAVVPIRMTLK